jgi:hypothetical protein
MVQDYLAIHTMGNDQMATQYELSFPNGIPGTDADTIRNILLRLHGAFTIPNDGVGTYDTWYKGIKSTRPNGVEESTKEFPLEIRVDENWQVYDAFKNWKNRVHNPLGGTVGVVKTDISDSSNIATLMKLSALSAYTHQEVKAFYFHYTVLRDIAVSAFDYSSGEPIILTLTFTFAIMSRNPVLSNASPNADETAVNL